MKNQTKNQCKVLIFFTDGNRRYFYCKNAERVMHLVTNSFRGKTKTCVCYDNTDSPSKGRELMKFIDGQLISSAL
ncbi:hypothetical protein FUAX_09990 [Fulvitalea axinellae]|uniref:Uncharacterized protein n=1 Tax=Fulvitalea axinellae TaxID=1182444 RepID=A0AAU9CNP9_9BACT|nr:hypothetical protein FUAX_09990 [Fulvitalea axinellae]